MHAPTVDVHAFAIGFDRRDRDRLHGLWDEVIDSEQWSGGNMTHRFEAEWGRWNGLTAVATGSWAGGALAALEFAGVRGRTVLCPSNTFMATPLAILAAGGRPVFVDCNRDDLCMSLADLEVKLARHRPRACVLVHIGGHLAFQSEAISELCRSEGVFLLEDCAHAHGASWGGRKPGTYGDAGVFSFYATKTVSTGEGGVLVTGDPELVAFARAFRDYGKPDHRIAGLNFRMSEFTAALGVVQTERLEHIVAWKNAVAREVLDPRHPPPPAAARGHGLRSVQVHSLRADRALERQGLRPALPSHHADRRPPTGHRLGRPAPLVRAALLPARAGLGVSRVLVTGGAGFIGSHVVDRLCAAGHQPRIFDLRPSPYRQDVETVIGDVRALESVRGALKGCDAVVHLAAAADVGEVARDPVGAEELNSRGTLSVLHAAREAGVARVLYASTIWVYSDVDATEVDEETLLSAPSHIYTATKLAGELYCRSYAQLYGVSTTILRFGIPYGPRARPAAVVPTFVAKALAGEPLLLAGGGTQARRFVYVEDLAEGVVRALAPAAANRTYNLVGCEDVTVRQIAETVREVVGSVELVEADGRPGDFAGAQVSGRRAAEELDWRAQTPFAEGLRRYVEWHRQREEPAALPAALPAAPPPSRVPRRTWTRARVAVFALIAVLLATLAVEPDAIRDVERLLGDHGRLSLIVATLLISVLATGARRRRVARA